MTIAFWCVLAAGLLPFVAAMIAKSKAGFDNHNPRAWLQSQEGFRQRANAAQLNAFESFPLFAAAVIIAHYLQAPQATIDQLALGFIAARVAYLICYVADWAAVRSLCWLAGMICTVAMFVVAA
jgi:uncharacterized MAPEG superfamily protein